MQAPVRPPSRQPKHQHQQQQRNRQTGGHVPGYPSPSIAIARGGRKGSAWPRPFEVRSAALSRHTGTPPATGVNASSPMKITPGRAVRPHGNKHLQGRLRDGCTSDAGADGREAIHPGPCLPIAGSIARGVGPLRSPEAIRRVQKKHGGTEPRQADLPRSASHESLASEHSFYSTLSQASGCSIIGAHQHQSRKPVKPPRPPGPPPPHILEEQRKKRELMVQQKMQQQSAYTSTRGGDAEAEENITGARGGSNSGLGESPRHGAGKERSRSANLEFPRDTRQEQSSLSAGTRDRVKGCTTHPVRAGPSILTEGESSSLRDCSGRHPGVPIQSNEATSPPMMRGRSQEPTGGWRQISSSSLPPVVRTFPEPGLKDLILSGQGAQGASRTYSPPRWREYWDEEVEASYYYNAVTREARWVPPEEL